LLATSLQAHGVVALVGDIGIRDSQTLRDMISCPAQMTGTLTEPSVSFTVPCA
jgi:regulator of RNase E activity RraA